MSAGHTPGPWHIGNGDIYADGSKSDDFDDVVICAIGRAGLRSHEYSVVKAHKPEGQANSLLIAASPCLIKALENLVAHCREQERIITEEMHRMVYCGESVPLCNARAAIARAKGAA